MAVFTGSGLEDSPSITFSADTDTGIFRPGADQIAITTNGLERLRIIDSGAIGLGGANYGTNGQVLTSSGPSAGPSWQTPPSNDKIEEGDTSAEVIDTGSDGRFIVTTDGVERLSVTGTGDDVLTVDGAIRVDTYRQTVASAPFITSGPAERASVIKPVFSADLEERVVALSRRYTSSNLNFSGFVGHVMFTRGTSAASIISIQARVFVASAFNQNVLNGNFVGLATGAVSPRFVSFEFGGEVYNGIQLPSAAAHDIVLDGWSYSDFTPFSKPAADVTSLSAIGTLTNAN